MLGLATEMFAENAYLAHLDGRGDCLVIDPGLDWPVPVEAPSGPMTPPDKVVLAGSTMSESETSALKRPRTGPTPRDTSAE